MQLTATHQRSPVLIPVVFIATIFLSAALLFFVQPLFAKMVLPEIGGSPAVWTTAMLFFQTMLIGGYLYAHLLTSRFTPRTQLRIHLALWAFALLFVPLSIPVAWQFDPSGPAAWQTLCLFALGVGLPFFALSANAPLIQSWYGQSGGPSAEDPYFLYGASNLGSLAALLGFPLVAEPLFGATNIGLGWTIGFMALGVFLLMSGLSARNTTVTTHRPAAQTGRIGMAQLIWWGFLAFVPSSLMLSLTTKISVDIGSFPLIWVIPLALYLLSFVVSFSGRFKLSEPLSRLLAGAALLVLLLNQLGFRGDYLSWKEAALLIFCFFVIAIVAHRKLYDARPDSSHLTTFYLTMSVGGALGGLFNSIIGPMLFAGLYETLATVLLAGLMLLTPGKMLSAQIPSMGRGVIIGLLLALPALLVGSAFLAGPWQVVLMWLLTGAVIAAVRLRSNIAACYGAAMVFLTVGWLYHPDEAVLRDRSFFGTHVITESQELRLYSNGTTIHGAQRLRDDHSAWPKPLYYYHPNGPMAQVLTSERGKRAQTIGVVGLGVGSLACYRLPSQDWHFYEIDPMVDAIARNAEHFRFVSTCTPEAPTYLGDARVVLESQESMTYDILVIDAYSSDSVPIHLTTNEAIALYMDRLAPGGVLVFHISNRYYEIEKPLSRSAQALGLEARIQHYNGNTAHDPSDSASLVVTLSRGTAALGDLNGDVRWQMLHSDGGRVWTDDFANLLSIMK